MRKYTTLLVALAFFQGTAFSQSCLPEGITFSTQAQIDSFQVNYSGCFEIEGNVTISGNDISNLNGLNVLTSIGGTMSINYCDSLTNLTGLDNLTSIEGSLLIPYNDALTTLTGLEGLTSIGGDLTIGYYYAGNPVLTNLTGLEGLTSIGGDLEVHNIAALTSLTGLEGLTSIGGDLEIHNNDALTSLTGLENVISIGGSLLIPNNDVLTNLTGLDNVTFIGGDLNIFSNGSLNNIIALGNLVFVGGEMRIVTNNALQDLSGLDNLTNIGGDFILYDNYSLNNLSGLENLDIIGGWIRMGILTIPDGPVGNPSLTDISGLENVSYIGGGLHILGNYLLSTCHIQSVCEYLAHPNGDVFITDNATGCNSQEEVEDACGITSVEEKNLQNLCTIYPNPFTGKTTFSIELKEPTQVNLRVIDNYGRIVATIVNESLGKGDHRITWNAVGLPSGIYLYKLTTSNQSATGKLVVVR